MRAPELMKIAATLLALLLLAAEGRAQSDVDGFDPGANNIVRNLAEQTDGKILVSGDFTTLGGGGSGTTTRNFIGRVNRDATIDAGFDPGANNSVLAMVVQADGQILVGGFFTILGGGGFGTTTRNFIGRLNADGTLDTSFDPGANGAVEALAVQADGKILVGGAFTTLGGGGIGTTTRNFIGRLNKDGSLDTTFDPGANSDVLSLVEQMDKKILVGGNFTILGGGNRVTIGRLNSNGTLDLAFNPGANNRVFALAEQTDGKILMGGDFTTLGGGGFGTTTRNHIGRLNADGTLDTKFDPGAGAVVRALTLQTDSTILVGGDFTTLGGGGTGTTTRNFIGRLNPDGTIDPSFDPGANSGVFALAQQADSKILVGGLFSTLGGGGTGTTTRDFIGRLGALVPPVITSPLFATGTIDLPFVYQFEASGATSLAVADIDLPGGLIFDPALSAITGQPGQTGTFQVGLSASNADGTTTATLTITIQPLPTSGPVIISSTSAKARTGLPFSFQVITSGASALARLTATGLPPGLSVDPVTGLISGTPAADGSSAVTLTVTDGSQIATGTLQLTFSSDLALPVIISPNTATLVTSQPFSYNIVAPSTDSSDPITYALLGPLPPGLGFDPVDGIISGTFQGKSQSVPSPQLSGGVITNVQLFATNSHGTGTIPLLFLLTPTGAVNISTRLAVGTNSDVLIGGFIVTGNAPKRVLIRAIGPSLPVTGTLQDPTLELHDSNGTLGTNDNWRDSQEQEIIDTTIPPTNDLESAIVATLAPLDVSIPGSGAYTVIVSGKNSSTGIGLVEVYDLGTASLDISSESKLANISTRGKVQTGDNVMIGGFIIAGSTGSNILVRAIGPELTGLGVVGALQDTTLELHDGSGNLLTSNDDWQSTQEQQIIDTGVPPTDPRESAIVAALNPGNYTAIVRGKNNTTGVALVEAYVLP